MWIFSNLSIFCAHLSILLVLYQYASYLLPPIYLSPYIIYNIGYLFASYLLSRLPFCHSLLITNTCYMFFNIFLLGIIYTLLLRRGGVRGRERGSDFPFRAPLLKPSLGTRYIPLDGMLYIPTFGPLHSIFVGYPLITF